MTNKNLIMIEIRRLYLCNVKKIHCIKEQDKLLVRGTDIDEKLHEIMTDYPDNMPLEDFKAPDIMKVFSQIKEPLMA